MKSDMYLALYYMSKAQKNWAKYEERKRREK